MFRIILGPLWKLVPEKNYRKTCATVYGYLDYYINEAFGEGDKMKSKSLIRGLSTQTDDSTFIRSQVIQAMMAAQDTTSELLTNALFFLARHPQYWEQLRAEYSHTSEVTLTAENLFGSKLIRNILHESKSSIQPRRSHRH
jgi:cytochrome P450